MDFNEFLSDYETDAQIKQDRAISVEIKSYFGFKTKDVLEYGCKTGLIAYSLKDKVNKFYLVDDSELMIGAINHKLATRPQEHFYPYCGNINELNFDRKFDVIYSSLTLHSIKDIQATINTLANLLKKNGKLIIIEYLPYNGKLNELNTSFHKGFEIVTMKEVLESAGLDEVLGRKFYSSYRRINGISHPYSLFSITGTKV